MRRNRALWKTGRSAGIEDRRAVVGAQIVFDERRTIGQRISGHERVRAPRVGHDVFGFRLAETRVDGYDRRGRHQRPEEGQRPIQASLQPDRDAVARTDAALAQTAGHARAAFPKLRERDALAADLGYGFGIRRSLHPGT